MRIPTITGEIRRRILLNYRIDPEVIQKQLPPVFRPKLQNGYAIAGICLIRLEQIKPKGLPNLLGIASENSAHRIAVTWKDESGVEREGVYVPRRDTDSLLNSLAGGRIFPGVHHYSNFSVNEEDDVIRMTVSASGSQSPLVDLTVKKSSSFPSDSTFSSLSDSSQFFENGSTGYSARPKGNKLDGLLLKVDNWKVSALEVLNASSTYFDDRSIFPANSVELDHALLMENIPHEWHSQSPMFI